MRIANISNHSIPYLPLCDARGTFVVKSIHSHSFLSSSLWILLLFVCVMTFGLLTSCSYEIHYFLYPTSTVLPVHGGIQRDDKHWERNTLWGNRLLQCVWHATPNMLTVHHITSVLCEPLWWWMDRNNPQCNRQKEGQQLIYLLEDQPSFDHDVLRNSCIASNDPVSAGT